ncbi:unnamed protein product [Camellia sinensis]
MDRPKARASLVVSIPTEPPQCQYLKMENVPPKLIEKTEEEDELSNICLWLLDFSDVDDFMVWATDDKVIQFYLWGTNTYASKEAAMNYIADVVIPHPWFRAICLDGRAIGAISVSPNRNGHRHW